MYVKMKMMSRIGEEAALNDHYVNLCGSGDLLPNWMGLTSKPPSYSVQTCKILQLH